MITGATPMLVNNDFNFSEEDVNVTIGGNSEGYRFVLQHGGTITLDNVTASLDGSSFIYQYVDPEEHLTLVLTGDNEITTTNDRAIYLEGCNELRLKCTGDSATLTTRGPRMEHYDVDNNATWYTWEFEVTAE